MGVLRAFLAGIAGLVIGFVLTATLGLLLIPGAGADNGGREMGIFFGLAPVGALLGAVVGIVIAARRGKRPPPA